jgi:dihydrodipicolinate reductase
LTATGYNPELTNDPEKAGVTEQDTIFVAGHRGMVGSAIVRRLNAAGENRVVTRTRSELDLTRQSDVEEFFADERIDSVYLAAARVGGIKANNDFPADFIRENLQIQHLPETGVSADERGCHDDGCAGGD